MDTEEELFVVVRNGEEQYSIWPADRSIPAGWEQDGEPRLKDACLEYIRVTWTDMRPLSLREAMAKS